MAPAFTRILIVTTALSLGACATPTPPVQVARFHLNQPIERGSVVIEPITGEENSLEFRTYAAAVDRELRRIGYVPSEGLATTLYVANVGIRRDIRPGGAKRSPVSIGLGGGSGGVGAGLSFGLGGGGSNNVVITQLSVQLKRKADQSVVWEGRAQLEAGEKAPAAQPGMAASKLAEALFGDFPGESGRTITVK